jgi:DNA-binding transcriptional LysR family regulator
MDRFDELAIFVRIVEEGSLVRAARRLRRSPPAVTRGLASLENRTGSRLIDRTTRRLAPTAAGLALLERARAVLSEYDAATTGTGDAPMRGLLRIAAPVQFGRRHVAPIAAEFLDRFVDVEIELLLSDRYVDLIDEAVDVAVRIGRLTDSSLIARPVGEVRRLWVASPGYLNKRGIPRTPADLVGHESIRTVSLGASDWVFAGVRKSKPLRLKGRLRVDDVETRLRAACAGRGIAQLLSYQVADDLAAGRLVRLLQSYEAPPIPVQLVSKSRVHRAARVDAFLDFAAKQLLALPAIRPENDPR